MQHVTWVAWSQGRVPVGFAHGDADFGAVNKTGGAKTVTLTIDQIPAHSHEISGVRSAAHNTGNDMNWTAVSASAGGNRWTNPRGGGHPHQNIQPYQVLYIWRRSA